jgi:peptide chain release factor 3
MLVDAAKGLEPQTRKLFEVARLRRLPLFTFVNKLDRPSLSPYELIDQIEREFGIACCPLLWPIGSGDRFKGVLERRTSLVHLFGRGERGRRAEETVLLLTDPGLAALIGDAELYKQLMDDVRRSWGGGLGVAGLLR